MSAMSLDESGDDERVVLVDDAGRPVGDALKSTVHSASTPLHLAFSLYLLDAEGRVLMTRRAMTKGSFAGVWSNSCCGHPRPGEPVASAVRRRCADELGIEVVDLDCVLPQFSYRAADAAGIWENEICPVFTGRTHPDAVLRPNNQEVMEWAWIGWGDLDAAVRSAPFVFSPWAVDQMQQMSMVAGATGQRFISAATSYDRPSRSVTAEGERDESGRAAADHESQ
jgi:isopentenyl-diphosphate Delta-isomerase